MSDETLTIAREAVAALESALARERARREEAERERDEAKARNRTLYTAASVVASDIKVKHAHYEDCHKDPPPVRAIPWDEANWRRLLESACEDGNEGAEFLAAYIEAGLRLDKASAEKVRDAALARAAALEAALAEACDEYAYAAEYKGEYLRDKHGDRETVARLRQALRDPAGALAERDEDRCRRCELSTQEASQERQIVQLREALAEARERVGACPCGSEACDPAAKVVARIDAALDAADTPEGGLAWMREHDAAVRAAALREGIPVREALARALDAWDRKLDASELASIRNQMRRALGDDPVAGGTCLAAPAPGKERAK